METSVMRDHGVVLGKIGGRTFLEKGSSPLNPIPAKTFILIRSLLSLTLRQQSEHSFLAIKDKGKPPNRDSIKTKF